ncbi:hypothetical protein EZS27_004674 [termite gut metagenome]|uniref:Uncharacterized protein n=1 Tax=termite gut metagenome TaxID=433724 RepID=A0A5J4SP01_9ZZZZ
MDKDIQPILLITEELLKLYSPFPENFETEAVIPFVNIAQKLFLEEVLGLPLVAELKVQIKDNDLTEENSTLIVEIAPALSLYSYYEFLPFGWAKILNKSLTVKESENSKAVSISDMSQLRLIIKNDADVFLRKLIDFLCSCKENYPLWKPKDISICKCSCEDTEGTNIKGFDTGIYFKKKLIK